MENPDHYKYMPRPQGAPEETERTDNSAETDAATIVTTPPAPEPEPSIQKSTAHEHIFHESGDGAATTHESEDLMDDWRPTDSLAIISRGVLKFFYDFFNPLLIPTYATILIFELSVLAIVAPEAGLPYSLTVFGATCVLPLIAFSVLRMVGAVNSISLEGRKERTFPYLIEILGTGAMTLFFLFKGAPNWLWLIYCGATATVLLNLLINFRIRVSNHCSAVAGLLAVLIVINNDGLPLPMLGWWAIGTVILGGILGTGAVLLGKHSLKDVAIGYATGFLPIILFTLIK